MEPSLSDLVGKPSGAAPALKCSQAQSREGRPCWKGGKALPVRTGLLDVPHLLPQKSGALPLHLGELDLTSEEFILDEVDSKLDGGEGRGGG
uniref:Uncharacterized protein n=1 Tax=Laticauda laticaudata TaxID=8630 RepID=A0A8C5SRB6_LATLA